MKSITIFTCSSWRALGAAAMAIIALAGTTHAAEVSVHISGVGTNNVSTPLYFKSEGKVNEITMIKAGLSQVFYYRGDENLVFHDDPLDFANPSAVPVASVTLPTTASRILLVGNQSGATINIDPFDVSSNVIEPGDYLFFNFSSLPLQFVYDGYPMNIGVGQKAVFFSGAPWRGGGPVALPLQVYRTDTSALVNSTFGEHYPEKRNIMFIYDTTVYGPITWYQFNDNEYLLNVQGVDDSVFPPVVGDPAAGVDTVSSKADPSALGFYYYPIIMSPIGASNPVRTISPASDDFPVTITGNGASTMPGALTLPDEIIEWGGTGTISQLAYPAHTYLSYGEIFPYIDSYIMKRRTLNVVVHPIGSVITGQPDDGPDMLPTQVQLEAYLNRIFEQQINVDINLTVLPQRNVAWDVANSTSYTGRTFTVPADASVPGDRRFDIRGATPEYDAVTTHTEPGDIHIYLLGGVDDMVEIVYGDPTQVSIADYTVLGHAETTLNQAFVNGEVGTVDSVMHVIAHEVGHILVGMGHPDLDGGPAPLGLGLEESKKRLMCSGENWNLLNPGRALVYGEWEAAEAKLQEFD